MLPAVLYRRTWGVFAFNKEEAWKSFYQQVSVVSWDNQISASPPSDMSGFDHHNTAQLILWHAAVNRIDTILWSAVRLCCNHASTEVADQTPGMNLCWRLTAWVRYREQLPYWEVRRFVTVLDVQQRTVWVWERSLHLTFQKPTNPVVHPSSLKLHARLILVSSPLPQKMHEEMRGNQTRREKRRECVLSEMRRPLLWSDTWRDVRFWLWSHPDQLISASSQI